MPLMAYAPPSSARLSVYRCHSVIGSRPALYYDGVSTSQVRKEVYFKVAQRSRYQISISLEGIYERQISHYPNDTRRDWI